MTVTPAYVAMMAAYNAEMNRRLYDAAGRLDDAGRRRDRGAFWRSIHETFAHLVWADRQWMHRFDGWEPNTAKLAGSGLPELPFDDLRAQRTEMDRRLEGWAARVTPEWLQGDLSWFSGAVERDVTMPLAILVPHMFNHQTHHRGQAHAMLTAAGQQTGATDLWVIL